MYEITKMELNDIQLIDITGGSNVPPINIYINIKPTINITHNMNLGILVLVNDIINKPVTFIQKIL